MAATRNLVYWVAAVLTLGAVAYAAPAGLWFTTLPARGPVVHEANGKKTIRGHVPVIWWYGGGYHGGK